MVSLVVFQQQPVVVHVGAVLQHYLRNGVGEEAVAGQADVAFQQAELGVALGHHQGARVGDPGLLPSSGDEHQVDRGGHYGIPGNVDQRPVPQKGGVKGDETVVVGRRLLGQSLFQHRPRSVAGGGQAANDDAIGRGRGKAGAKAPVYEHQSGPARISGGCAGQQGRVNPGFRVQVQRVGKGDAGHPADVGVLPFFVAAAQGGHTQLGKPLPCPLAQMAEPSQAVFGGGQGLEIGGVLREPGRCLCHCRFS